MPKHARTDKSKSFENEYPDAVESLEPEVSDPLLFVDEESVNTAMVVTDPVAKRSKHGNRPSKSGLSAQQKKSRRMRWVLVVVVVLLVVLIGVLGFCTWMLFEESKNLASQ
ncbi:MAG: hypothetical protein RR547_13905, partial [Raoultibacter sp.]